MSETNFFPAILTLNQAADYLQISSDVLQIELEQGRIPGLRIAGQWRLKRDILERLFEIAADPQADANTLSGIGAPESAAAESGESQVALAPIESHPVSEPPVQDLAQAHQIIADSTPDAFAEVTATPAAPPPGRVWAKIFVYNTKQGFGYARLSDNRLIVIESNYIQGDIAPLPGDTVEFELAYSRKGSLQARKIIVLPKKDTPKSYNVYNSSPLSPEVISDHGESVEDAFDSDVKRDTQGSSLSLQTDMNSKAINEKPRGTNLGNNTNLRTYSARPGDTKSYQSVASESRGSPESQGMYQKAAVARAEGRIDEARRLFRQAIAVGAGTQVYAAFVKMEIEQGGTRAEARRILQQAIKRFPSNTTFYEMYGQMERHDRNYDRAENIFRQGLAHAPGHVSLRWGLGQTLVQIGTDSSLREAGTIFAALEREGKLHKHDGLYQRFKVLQRNERVNKAFEFFKTAKFRVGIAGQKELPTHISDIVTEINIPEFSESFGLSGGFLVRCFKRTPGQIDIINLIRFLRRLGPHSVIGLQTGREVVLNSSLAFIAVPDSDEVRDQIMSILSDSNEAIVPLDDHVFQNTDDALKMLRDLLGQYLGQRDLYSSTMPVSSRRFFGREKLLLQLTDDVHRGQFLGIYGLRKMGKTSLIYQLRDEKLGAEAVAYVDLQGSAALTMKECTPLYWELERDLYLRIVERDQEAASILRLGKFERFSDLPDNGIHASLLFTEDMRAFLDLLSMGKIANIKRLVIVLDELERILPVAGQPGVNGYLEFFALLRGLAQTERYRSLLSSVVVAANASISERGYWEGRENPVFALYKPIFLPPLAEDECIEMIRSLGKGMSVYWDDDAIQEVYKETGGHPFLTRALCSRIAKRHFSRPLTVTSNMVQEEILPFIRNESDKMEQITELLRTNFPEEEIFLQQIALDEDPGELHDEQLRHLLGYHLIVADTAGYRITLNLLRRWLRRRAGLRE